LVTAEQDNNCGFSHSFCVWLPFNNVCYSLLFFYVFRKRRTSSSPPSYCCCGSLLL